MNATLDENGDRHSTLLKYYTSVMVSKVSFVTI